MHGQEGRVSLGMVHEEINLGLAKQQARGDDEARQAMAIQ
jgi:hypothetical protein